MNCDRKFEVVISGLSGQYPESENVDELWTKLVNKEDMITIDGRRWAPGEFDVPPGTGKILHSEHFDMTFFGIHRKLCEKMDPYTRLLCEQAFRAVCDAGVNPKDLDGTSTAVIMSSFASEPELDLGASLINQGSYNVLAFSRTMQANRLSYFLNLKGPSFQLDNSTCGGIQAIQNAADLIATGMCTAAIVGGCSLLFKGEASFHYQMMGRLSEDSTTRSFSSDAAGYARSEGCVAVFLQRKDHAKRIYGTVLGANVVCHGSKDLQFPGFPRELYYDFLVETYKQANVDPQDLVYVEAHGAASLTLDALELNTLSEALLKRRSKPLLIGSVKSNLGHSEGAASMVSLTKALLALDRGVIPPNINYSKPNPNVPALVSGKLQVVTELTPLDGGTIAVCELGVTGNCAHIIVKGNEKRKSPAETKLPYLLTMSARNESALEKNMEDLQGKQIDEEFVLLLNSLYREGIKNHVYRGYSVVSGEPNNYKMIGPAPGGEKKPIWFMYSGMGSQWPSMAKDLMGLPIFANAIHKCHKILEPKGVNLLEIVCKKDDTVFDNILHSFVGIAAVQIGLTDLIKSLGIEPDGIIGHSVGELGCAYADGCMTAEQMILSAHARGRASVEATLIKGMMAAVGAGYNQMKNVIPETIEVACHNSKESCTLSGPADDMAVYIDQLKAKGMFAKLVNVANIAYHSRYIKPAAPALLKYLKEIIPVPVKRSPRWVSSSNLESNWSTDLAQHSSAEYHTNNLLSSVLFEEASAHIPSDAIVIEIAPHGLLQAIVKRSLPRAIHIPLTSRFDPNNLMFLLGAVGKMFMAGIPIDLQQLYPSASFPVSRGTPAISPLIDWSREVNFPIDRLIDDPDASSPLCRFVIVNRSLDDSQILYNHKIHGKSVVPTSFYLNEIIDHYTSFKTNDSFPIMIEKMKVLGYSEFCSPKSTELRFQLLQGRGNVVVTNNNTNEIVLECNIRSTDVETVKTLPAPETNIENMTGISQHEILSFMKSFGVDRDPSLISLDNVIVGNEYFRGNVKWEGDIGKFLMSLLVLIEFIETRRSYTLTLFDYAGEIFIDLPFLRNSPQQNFVFEYDLVSRTLHGEAVLIARVECRSPRLSQHVSTDSDFSFELPHFIPYVNNNALSYSQCINMCMQIIFENTKFVDDTVVRIVEIGSSQELHDALRGITELVKYGGVSSLTSYQNEKAFRQQCSSLLLQENMWVVCADVPSTDIVQSMVGIKNGFILSPKDKDGRLEKICKATFEARIDGKWYALYAIKKPNMRQYKVVQLTDGYLPVLETQLLMAGNSEEKGDLQTVILWGQVDSMIAVDQILEETKNMPNNQNLHYWLFYGNVPEANFSNSEFKSQFEKDVRINISKDGNWGRLGLTPSNVKGACVSSPSHFYYPLSAVAESNNIVALGLSLDNESMDISVPKLGAFDYVSSNKTMGIGTYDENSKTFTPDPILSWKKPTQWTSKEAATVPLMYSLASFILHQVHSTDDNSDFDDTILVNRALLPLSQAIISLALHENKKVHATVCGETEKHKLLALFPKLNPQNIYDCSTVSFFVDVLRNTKDGAYKVINTFDDPVMIEPSMKCTKPSGALIYANQSIMTSGKYMRMGGFVNEVIARGVSEDILMKSSDEVKMHIKNKITKALQAGAVVPIRATSSVAPSMLNSDAAAYLESNSNKVIVETNNTESSVLVQSGNMDQIVVEGKIQVDLSMEIVEWALKRGSRRVLLFSRQSRLLEASSLRLQSLREHYQNAVVEVRPSSQLSGKSQIEKIVKERATSGPSTVFFLGSGLKEKMEIFDQMLPDNCNMICIGKDGESVCERRIKNSLPALCIRCSAENLEDVNLLHYMDSLIKDSPRSPVVLVKKYDIRREQFRGLLGDLNNLPDSDEELKDLVTQSTTSTKATFAEIPSAAPPTKQNRELYPMFFIPGLRPNRLRKLASQLFCPTMEARIPVDASSIDKIANDLADYLLSLPHNMFTLCAEGWGGILGLHLASKLSAKSKYVNLVLLEASPASVKKWSENLLKNELALIKKYLQIPAGIVSNMKNSSWEEELQFGIENSLLTNDDQKSFSVSCLNLLRRRLLSAVNTEPPVEKLNIKCHLVGLQKHAHESHGLEDYLRKEPTVHAVDSKTVDEMIDDVATDVNTFLLFEHKDAANPPIDEYLGCNIIKKYLPHWQASTLFRVRE